MLKILGLVALLIVAVFWFSPEDVVEHPPGPVALAQPLQERLAKGESTRLRDYTLRHLARFKITARVLGREDYAWDRESDLAPVDLALGWGAMSDSRVLDRMEISQGNRWYRWRTPDLPIPRREIQDNSANMHMIPGSEHILDSLKDIRRGDVVTISGYLVEARAPDGWRWRSSLTRKDSGANACEVVLVSRLRIHPRP